MSVLFKKSRIEPADKSSPFQDDLSCTRSRTEPLPDGPAGLVIIDPQRLFLDPASPICVPDADRTTANILKIAGIFMKSNLPIVATRHLEDDMRGTNPVLFPRALTSLDPMSNLIAGLNDACSSGKIPIREKNSHDAFSSGLPVELENVDILFMAGVLTPLCVLATAIGLARHGIFPVVIFDACAAKTAADHHAALRCLAAGHAWLRTTEETADFLAAGLCTGVTR